MKYGHPDSGEAKETVRQQRLREKLIERRQWAEYQRTYERCKAIAEAVWCKELAKAAEQQQTLTTQMRDRAEDATSASVGGVSYKVYPALDRGIYVPLFTPRDRLQFLKEATASLFIGTERRGLTVTPEVKDVEATKADERGPGIPEAASGTDEAQLDAEAEALDATTGQERERVPEAPAPSL